MLKSFLKMLTNYGRGRAEQFRLHPTPGSALNFVPPLFCLYLVFLAAVELAGRDSFSSSWRLIFAAPLGFYLLAVIGQTLASIPTSGIAHAILAMPLLVASHIFYGLGFWRGLFTKLKTGGNHPRPEVSLEKIQLG